MKWTLVCAILWLCGCSSVSPTPVELNEGTAPAWGALPKPQEPQTGVVFVSTSIVRLDASPPTAAQVVRGDLGNTLHKLIRFNPQLVSAPYAQTGLGQLTTLSVGGGSERDPRFTLEIDSQTDSSQVAVRVFQGRSAQLAAHVELDLEGEAQALIVLPRLEDTVATYAVVLTLS